MAQDQFNSKFVSEDPEENGLSLRDFISLCMMHWQWFVLSVLTMLILAGCYLMVATPKYTRSASVMIKDDDTSNGISGLTSQFADMGLFSTSSNVNNEMLAFTSPALMKDVIERLGLEVDYTYRPKLKRLPMYGDSLRVKVDFLGLTPEQGASLTVTPDGNGHVELSKIRKGKIKYSDKITVAVGDTAQTPLGLIAVAAGPAYSPTFDNKITVVKLPIPAAIMRYQAKTKFDKPDKDASVIEITCTDASPQRANDVIGAILDIYNQKWVSDKNQMARATSDFINERLQVIEKELGNVDSDISSYKSEHLMPDLKEASKMFMERANENTKQQLQLATQQSIAKYLRQYVAETVGAGRLLPANSGLESSGIESQIKEYNTLQLERDNLASNSGQTNPLVQDYDRNLKSMRTAIISSLDNLIITIDTQISALNRADRATNQQIASSPTQAKYLLSVERQQKVKEELYLYLLQKREENELSRAFTSYNTRLITPPMGDNLPASPKKRNILLIAFVLGLIIPAGVVFIQASFDTLVRNRQDLEGLNVPNLGEIPQAPGTSINPWSVRVRRFIANFSKKKKPEKVTAPLFAVRPHSHTMLDEAFRSLRTSVEFMTASQTTAKPVMMVTSFNPGSGKSFISLNLAAAMAMKKGTKVVAVDLDLRRASLSCAVNSPARGVADYLNGSVTDLATVTVSSGTPGLDIIPVGILPPNPAELLYSERMRQLLDSLREKYDYVLLDCPPVEIVTDASVISRHCDLTLFVVRASLFDRRMLPQIDKYYTEKRLRNMAVVLNGTQAELAPYSRYTQHNYYHSNYYTTD